MTESNDKPILVAVDFSSHSEAALVWAADAARCFAAPLIVLHVVHDPASAPGYYVQPDEAGDDAPLRVQQDVAQDMLDQFIREAAARRPDLIDPGALRTRLVVGLPANRILEVAEQEGARLIVVGSQGRTGLSHVLLGSKAARVAQLSHVPVTIVRERGSA